MSTVSGIGRGIENLTLNFHSAREFILGKLNQSHRSRVESDMNSVADSLLDLLAKDECCDFADYLRCGKSAKRAFCLIKYPNWFEDSESLNNIELKIEAFDESEFENFCKHLNEKKELIHAFYIAKYPRVRLENFPAERIYALNEILEADQIAPAQLVVLLESTSSMNEHSFKKVMRKLRRNNCEINLLKNEELKRFFFCYEFKKNPVNAFLLEEFVSRRREPERDSAEALETAKAIESVFGNFIEELCENLFSFVFNFEFSPQDFLCLLKLLKKTPEKDHSNLLSSLKRDLETSTFQELLT